MQKSTNQPFLSLTWSVNRILASLFGAPLLFGATLSVPAGGDFQQALNSAQPGDTIVLAAGATYTGQFTLPYKTGDAWITIQSSQLALLPPAGKRVGPQHRDLMPRLVCPNGYCPALQTAPGAHHYRLIGIEFAPGTGTYAYDLITVGSASATTADQQAHHIEFDRVYAHGDALAGSKRGIALQSAWTTIKNSYLSDFKSDFQDAQAICGWNGPGPYRIENNYLEASGENVMFGGAAPSIPGLIPSDIGVFNNHFRKPPEWREVWRLKNLFELKNAQRVTVWGNVFENNWVAAQSGYALMLTVRTCEAGDYNWAVVRDVSITYNYLTNVVGGADIMGQDHGRDACGGGTAGQTSNIVIANNVFDKIENGFLILDGAQDIFIDHNTAFPTRSTMILTGDPSQEIMFTNNLSSSGGMGVFGDGKGSGSAAIRYYCHDSLFKRNVLFNSPSGGIPNYPYDNAFLTSVDGVGFADAGNGDYALTSSSAYGNAGLDGLDLGADVAGLKAAISGVTAGNPQRAEACFVSATPIVRSMGSNGGDGQEAVSAAAGCPWTAASRADWITVTSGASGNGNGAFQYSVNANSGDRQRTGTVSVGPRTLTVVQERSGCSYSITPAAQTFSAGKYSGNSFTVTSGAECNWSATASESWIGVYGGDLRTGTGSVYVELGANSSPTPRVGTVTAGGQIYTVTQVGSGCSVSVNPAAQTAGSGGGPATISVTGGDGCAWTAASNVSWIAVTSGSSGSGNGVVGYAVAPNGSPVVRTGTLLVAGQVVTVTQAGIVCSYSVNPAELQVPAAGGTGTIVVGSPAGCGWTASSAAAWIAISSGGSGSGTGVVSYSIEPNTSTSTRASSMAIAGQTVAVTQQGQSCPPEGCTAADITPLAVFRASDGRVLLTSYGSTSVSYAPGSITSAPAIALEWNAAPLAAPGSNPSATVRLTGNAFVVGRSGSCVYLNVFTHASQSWLSEWMNVGCGLYGDPAVVATPNGDAYVVARDSSYRYEMRRYRPGLGFEDWIVLGGSFVSDPAAAAAMDGTVYVVGWDFGRRVSGGIYVPGSGFGGWSRASTSVRPAGKPAVTVGSDGAAYVAARSSDRSIWMARLEGNVWEPWSNGGGSLKTDPSLAATGGMVYATVTGSDNLVRVQAFREGSGNGWQGWVEVSGSLVSPAIAAWNGIYFIVGQYGGRELWWYKSDARWTKAANVGLASNAPSASPR